MVFFRKYKWLFLVTKSEIKPWVLKEFSFAQRAHIQRIDSYLSIYSCWKYKSLKKFKEQKIDLNWTQPNLHATTENFLFSTLNHRTEIRIERNLNNPSVWILSVPLSLKGTLKCSFHLNVLKLYTVEDINTICSVDHSFWFTNIFKAVK